MTIAGIEPRATVEPATVAELVAQVGELYARDIPFAFVGGQTEIERGNAPRSLDTIVRTTRCRSVIDYAPQDQTITVEAGMTVADVNAVLSEHGQFLALDVPHPERTTIGGAIATNAYGRRRLRFGSIKDTIVGIEIVRPDGVRARGGGKVVKNVAGFDIPKLMVGSLGTLAGIISATFRVYPIEEKRAVIAVRGIVVERAFEIGRALLKAQLVPAAYSAFAAGDGYDAVVEFEGFAGGVDQQVAAVHAIAAGLGCAAETLDDEAARAYVAREREIRSQGSWRFTLSAPPHALAAHLTRRSPDERVVAYPLLGTAFVASETLDAATVRERRSALADGSLVVDAMPLDARTLLDAWGEPRAGALAIMKRLKTNFDPKGLCNPGRYIGGL